MWRRSTKWADDAELLLDLVRMVMRVDAKLDRVLEILREDYGEEEMDT